MTTFPTTVYYLDPYAGVSRTAIAISESSTTFRINNESGVGVSSVRKIERTKGKFRTFTKEWTADRAKAERHDVSYVRERVRPITERIARLEKELAEEKAALEKHAARLLTWTNPATGSAP